MSGKRGCGSKEEGGLYLCVETDPNGQPVEYFLIDPVIPWLGGTLRSPMVVESIKHKGAYNVIMGVGKQYYPTLPSYIQEVKSMGVSKRIPLDFPVDKLTPYKSRLILMHPRAIPEFEYEIVKPRCPKNIRGSHQCIGDLWPLSALHNVKDKHEVEELESGRVKIHTPSVWYEVDVPVKPKKEDKIKLLYEKGLFMSFPVFHLEFVSKKGEIPMKVKEKADKAKINLDICEI